MTRYVYRAKKGPTDIIDDVVEAQSRDEAVEKISRLGYLPIKVQEEVTAAQEKKDKSKIAFVLLKGRVRSKDVTIFSRQLASLVKSGVPILRALNILSEQSESSVFREMIVKISTSVKEGQSFSQSLEAWPSAFSAFYIAMVRSGEDSGTLQETLLRIAAYRQKQEELMAKVKTAMAYPILMALVGAGTVIFMFVFVMPKLSAIFATMGQELPIQTKIVIAISVFLRQKWPVLIVAIVALVLLIAKTSTFKARRRIMSAFVLRVPVFNRFLRFNEFARFSRTLEVMVKSGIPILRALSVSIPVLDNEIIKTELYKSAKDLEQGMSFGKSLAKSKIFPTFMVSLILVGEESGKLDESLGEVADAYESECDEAIKVLTSLLEPLMILVMGLIVGFIVMAMLLPIFQINVMVR